jgi:hypothetical protein
MTRNEFTDHFGRNKSSNEIGDALALLQQHGLARNELRPTGGRAAEVWKAMGVQDAQTYEKNEKSPDLVRFSRFEKSGDALTSEPKPPESEDGGLVKDGSIIKPHRHRNWGLHARPPRHLESRHSASAAG